MRYNAHILGQERTELQEAIPLPAPFTVLVEVSRLCNFHCSFCPQSKKAGFTFFDNNLMDTETFGRLTGQMLEFPRKIRKVYMHGTGESTLNPRLADMIAFLKGSGATELIDLTTNGALLDEKLGKALVGAGLDHLHISVEALSSEQYALVTGVSGIDFEQFVNRVQAFSKQRGKCRLTIKIASTSLNTSDDKERFLDIFSPLCDEIFIENIFPIWPDFPLQDSLITDDCNFGQYGQPQDDKDVCPQIFTTLAVKCDGSVSPCSVDWNNKAVLGNMRTSTLRDIWNGDKLRSFQLHHLRYGRKTQNPCALCGLPKYSCIDNIDAYRNKLAEKIGKAGG